MVERGCISLAGLSAGFKEWKSCSYSYQMKYKIAADSDHDMQFGPVLRTGSNPVVDLRNKWGAKRLLTSATAAETGDRVPVAAKKPKSMTFRTEIDFKVMLLDQNIAHGAEGAFMG